MDEQQTPKAPVIKIDGVDYAPENLSDRAKGLIATLQMADRELAEVEGRATLLRIARQTVASNLRSELAVGTPEGTTGA